MSAFSHVYDVIVLGGGIAGSTTAEILARRGRQVLLLEQFEPGHTRGSSHGDGRIIRFAYTEPIYLHMAKLAYPAWAELAERAGEPLMQTTGIWMCGSARSTELAMLEINFINFGLPYERLSAADSNKRYPHFRLEIGSEAIIQPDGGVIFATRAVQALWRLAAAAGATMVTGERIIDIVPLDDKIHVHSASGFTWSGKRLVVAAGGWSRSLLASLDLDLPLEVTQEQVMYFPAKNHIYDHRLGAMPVFVDCHTSHPFYGLPQIDIPGVKIGWHHSGPVINADERLPFSEGIMDVIQGFVRTRLPYLMPKPVEVMACLYTNTPDYHFILDRHPDLPHIAIGAGFSGHGFKFGPIIGQILAALALDESPPMPLNQFAISRFADMDC